MISFQCSGDDFKQCSKIMLAATTVKKHSFRGQSVLTRGSYSQMVKHLRGREDLGTIGQQ